MDLKEFFASQCRECAEKLNIENPAIRKLTSQNRKAEELGVCAVFSFEGYKVLISYIEAGKSAYAQQTLWVSVSLDSDRQLPFSLYDILAFIEPENFNCYTYTYVDSQALMKNCFNELTELLVRITPALTEFLENGITKNRLISTQKDNINRYFGDNVLESGEMLGGAGDKIIAMMLQNFYEAEIEAAVVGSQSLFYSGKDEKALKRLKKSKRNTLYQQNLQRFLENGGKSNPISNAVAEASMKKGALRHGGGVKSALKTIAFSLLFTIPVAIGLGLIYTAICALLFRGNVFIAGFYENLLILPFFSFLLGTALALNFVKSRQENKKKTDEKTVHTPKAPKAVNEALKYFTIAAESLALIGCITCVFSTAPFYEYYFEYSQEDFPLSQSECMYESIDFIGVIEGFYDKNNKFYEEKYIVVKTKSGQTIDLYNSTWLSANKFTENEDFFTEQGIEIKTFKTFEDYKKHR